MREFPGRLHHAVPSWVSEDSIFHIRVRCRYDNPVALTDPVLGVTLLESVRLYARRRRWWPHLFLLMPDHWHALLSFPVSENMSTVVGQWKAFHARHSGVIWQDNYFDHRLRSDESVPLKAWYIRSNPVVKGLCERVEDWPWVIEGG
ncbi:MAG: transposase [Candidatus Binatia bacterium]